MRDRTGKDTSGQDLTGRGRVRELRESRELLVNLTLRDVRSKYKRTALGRLWSLLNPLAAMLVFTVVFGLVFRVQLPPGEPSGLNLYALWLMCGLLPWTFFSNAMSSGMGSLLDNANLLKKVYFPREVLVTATVLSWMVTFLTEMAVLTAAILVAGGMPLPWLPLVLVLVGLLGIFTLGVALALATANVYFRDTQHFIGIFLQIWFYATPIVYPITYIQDLAVRANQQGYSVFGHPLPIEFVYRLNPMERFVTVFRDFLYDNRLPSLGDSMYCAAAAVLSLVIGWTIFRRFDGRLVEEL